MDEGKFSIEVTWFIAGLIDSKKQSYDLNPRGLDQKSPTHSTASEKVGGRFLHSFCLTWSPFLEGKSCFFQYCWDGKNKTQNKTN